MKFIKGLILGSMVSAGIAFAYTESMGDSRKKMIKKGKKIARKMGIIY